MMEKDNPYRLHKYNRRQFSKSDCCGMKPERSGMEIYCHSVSEGEWAWQPLYRCPRCGRYYLKLGDAYLEIENPMGWERREDCNLTADMIP